MQRLAAKRPIFATAAGRDQTIDRRGTKTRLHTAINNAALVRRSEFLLHRWIKTYSTVSIVMTVQRQGTMNEMMAFSNVCIIQVLFCGGYMSS